MTSFNATELQQLVNSTHNVLRLYYQKDKWPKLFPLLSQLAEQYDQAYQQNPRAMQSQLLFYIAKQGYTTNLIINQTIICTAISNSLGYDPETRYSLIGSNLVQLICAQKESNLLANQEVLTLQSQKLWHQRFNLAIKLLNAGHVKNTLIYEVLANLSATQQKLSKNELSHLDNQYTQIIALSHWLAKKITPTKTTKGQSLNAVLQYAYLHFQSSFLRSVILSLSAHLPDVLPGTCFKWEDSLLMYVCQLPKGRHLTFKFNKNAITADGKWHPITTIPHQCLSQQSCHDPRLLFALWFKPLAQVVERFIQPQSHALVDNSNGHNIIEQLQTRAHWQTDTLLSVLAADPFISRSLCEFTTQQTTQTISELKHAVLLLGPNRIPLVVHKLALLNRLNAIKFPNCDNLQARILSAVLLIESIALQGYDDFIEYASITLLEVVIAQLTGHHNQIIGHTSQASTCSGLQRLDISALLMIEPRLPISENIVLPRNIPRNWQHAVNHLADIKTVKPSSMSTELACLVLAISQINQLFSIRVEPCALSNALVNRANDLLKTQLTAQQLLSEQQNDYVLSTSACCVL